MSLEFDEALDSGQVEVFGDDTKVLIHDAIVAWINQKSGSRVESIDYDDSLLGLGVDSMGVADLATEIETKTGKRLVPEEVFELEVLHPC